MHQRCNGLPIEQIMLPVSPIRCSDQATNDKDTMMHTFKCVQKNTNDPETIPTL